MSAVYKLGKARVVARSAWANIIGFLGDQLMQHAFHVRGVWVDQKPMLSINTGTSGTVLVLLVERIGRRPAVEIHVRLKADAKLYLDTSAEKREYVEVTAKMVERIAMRQRLARGVEKTSMRRGAT
jgi:hypothetical protein